MKKEFICIVCPRGCHVTVDEQGVITGNECKRGIKYVETEMNAPTRMLTTTVRTVYPEIPRVSVKTDQPIPKGLIYEAMDIINQVVIDKPMKIGEIVVKNILGTESNIVLTKSCLK